jgi:1-acyl-sn-glycerol-3-phosphate acyltransferase
VIAAFCRAIVRTFFREIVVEGHHHLPGAGPVILTPNHPNALLDPLVLIFLSPAFRLRFVAKAPLFSIPVLGWMLRRFGAIAVVRRFDVEGSVDYSSFFSSCCSALAGGEGVVIFPEGRSQPHPTMASLRTGAARLFFLARQQGVRVPIIPIGLNYERGAIFRSSVLISIAPPLETESYWNRYQEAAEDAVRELTAAIARTLQDHVFQAESFRDRELMLLLERLYDGDQADLSWAARWARLKAFEQGLARLHRSAPQEIARVRQLLTRYERIARLCRGRQGRSLQARGQGIGRMLIALLGLSMSAVGVALNWLPYRLCGRLVRLTHRDEADAATYKVVYALVLFPATYLVEAVLVGKWLGAVAAVGFCAGIIPLTYITLLFVEWWEAIGRPLAPADWFGSRTSRRAMDHLHRLRRDIIAQVDALAARPELQASGDDSLEAR